MRLKSSVTSAAKIQSKHRRVIEKAPLDIILLESDGPYDYRGMRLEPKLIPELLNLVSKIKGIEVSGLIDFMNRNFRALVKFL